MSFVHLRLRTEYSFRQAYGRPPEVLERIAPATAAGIADNGTWGHVAWFKACKAAGVRPLLGVEILVVPKPEERERQPGAAMAFLARDGEGLSEIYRLVSWSQEVGFYYVPRIGYEQVNKLSSHVNVLSGAFADLELLKKRRNVWLEMNPLNRGWNRTVATAKGWKKVVCASNRYPGPEHKQAYEIVSGSINRRDSTQGLHIFSEDELRLAIPEAGPEAYDETENVLGTIELSELPRAQMLSAEWPKTLEEMCREGIRSRKLKWTDEYEARMMHELAMIKEKNFGDYFQVIADMVNRAKETMLVGPARGSAAGSLVCYLLRITDVDPILHGLMFERFIDVTRSDLPDIDLDFPDRKRDQVIAQLGERWGKERVGRIGTVMRYGPKSALDDVARELGVPSWEVGDVKGAITDRSSGDERAAFAVADALDQTDIGKALVEKYPAMALAGVIEGHARQSGMHAAGVVVTSAPLELFAARDHGEAYQMDKEDAEALNMLKIDALGLRTLSVIEDTLEQIGKDAEWLNNYPLDDEEAFEVLNEERYAGIFQFEGYALQALCRQMKVREFNDISCITALARPGPLHCGAASEFVDRRIGKAEIVHLHPMLTDLTSDTYGSVIFQEQVMFVCHRMGKFSWPDVSFIRKAMSKTLGEETFKRFWVKFREGAMSQGVTEKDAKAVWDKICTFGSWAFNKSHAVSYGLISYWCAMLKAHYPLEFGAACLRNAKDNDQALRILRELVKEGYEYIPVDPERSGLTWEVHDGKLLGGLTNIHGIGESKARDIIARREAGKAWTPGIAKLLLEPKTPFDHVFEAQERFADIFANPEKYDVTSGALTQITDIQDAGEYVFVAKINERKLRDHNEAASVAKRGGRRLKGQTIFLNLVLEDDTGTIIAKINSKSYKKWGKPIVEQMKEGDYCLWKGYVQKGWRIVYITKWRRMGENWQSDFFEAKAKMEAVKKNGHRN